MKPRTRIAPYNLFKVYYDDDGKIHRDDGPAIEYSDIKFSQYNEWYHHGKKVSAPKNRFLDLVNDEPTPAKKIAMLTRPVRGR